MPAQEHICCLPALYNHAVFLILQILYLDYSEIRFPTVPGAQDWDRESLETGSSHSLARGCTSRVQKSLLCVVTLSISVQRSQVQGWWVSLGLRERQAPLWGKREEEPVCQVCAYMSVQGERWRLKAWVDLHPTSSHLNPQWSTREEPAWPVV